MDRRKLGAFGDSFATTKVGPEIVGTPWPITLAAKLDRELESHAHPGTSIWWSYVKFLEHHEKYDTIVFSYSQHNRWHHLSEECDTMYHLTIPLERYNTIPNPTPERERIAKILYDAYRYTNSEQLDVFIYQNVFNSINDICRDKGINLVNLMPFERDENGNLTIDYSNRAGPIIYNLDGLTRLELSKLTKNQYEAFYKMIVTMDLRPCHINYYHNDLVADVVSEVLDKNDYVVLDISKDPRASSDPKYNSMFYEDTQ